MKQCSASRSSPVKPFSSRLFTSDTFPEFPHFAFALCLLVPQMCQHYYGKRIPALLQLVDTAAVVTKLHRRELKQKLAAIRCQLETPGLNLASSSASTPRTPPMRRVPVIDAVPVNEHTLFKSHIRLPLDLHMHEKPHLCIIVKIDPYEPVGDTPTYAESALKGSADHYPGSHSGPAEYHSRDPEKEVNELGKIVPEHHLPGFIARERSFRILAPPPSLYIVPGVRQDPAAHLVISSIAMSCCRKMDRMLKKKA